MIALTARWLFLTLIWLFLAAPLLLVVGVSFNGSARMDFPPEHPSLRWYAAFFADPGWTSALVKSLTIAGGAALLAVGIALPISYAAWRYGSRGARWLAALAQAAFQLPPIVLGILYLSFWSWLGHTGRIENTIFGHAVIFVSLPLTTITLGFRSVDWSLIEAGMTMGAREADVQRTILLPLLLPYIVCGAIFVFIVSLNEYLVANLVAGFEVETLPIKVFNSLRMGFQPTVCVGAVLFFAIGLIGLLLVAGIGDFPKLLGNSASPSASSH